MKISITGHTSGIGLALSNYFSTNHDVIGFSRSNGYDISDENSRKNILEKSLGSDIFINNAYNDYDGSQLEMLKLVTSHNEFSGKIVINISSRYTTDSNNYCNTKAALDKFCESFIFNRNIKLINLKPGLIVTPRVTSINNPKMSADDVVNIIKFVIDHSEKFNIHSICFGK
jgi:NADP-dependent 3-hydroxy acid dehydrogenase YdfG